MSGELTVTEIVELITKEIDWCMESGKTPLTERQVALICAIAVAFFRTKLKILTDMQDYATWFETWLDTGKW